MDKEKALEKLIRAASQWRSTRRGDAARSEGTAVKDYMHEQSYVGHTSICAEEHDLAVAIDNYEVAK